MAKLKNDICRNIRFFEYLRSIGFIFRYPGQLQKDKFQVFIDDYPYLVEHDGTVWHFETKKQFDKFYFKYFDGIE
jgi:hypothetical protein